VTVAKRPPRNWAHVCIGATTAGEVIEYGQIGGTVYLPLAVTVCPDCGTRLT